jgi:hypothetical protein
MSEDKGKQEEKFDFTNEGETFGYISLDQAQVLAMQLASHHSEFYSPEKAGTKFNWSWIKMVWEVELPR